MNWVATAAKWIVGIVLLGLLALAAWSIFQPEEQTRVHLGDSVFSVAVAANEQDRQQGLSGVRQLKQNSGMLFAYAENDRWGIWMKDMHIALDIVWLDEEKRVVHIVKNATPDTYPQVFRPETPARYVLELNAGAVERNNVQVGKKAEFALPQGTTVE